MRAFPTGAGLWRLAAEHAPTALLILDADGRIVLANRAVEGLFDLTRSELVGASADILVAEADRDSRPFSWPADGPTADLSSLTRDVHGRRRDGSEVPLEIVLRRLDTEHSLLTLASVTDSSSRTQAEDRFRVAVESSPSGMLIVDPKGAIVLVNRETERMLGYAQTELVGQSIEVLVPDRYRRTHPGHRAGFFSKPSSRPMGAGIELFARRKDGTEIPVEIGLNPIQIEGGTYVLSSLVDISARRELEGQLRQSQKMEAVGTLAGGIAHDFNNILRAIVGFTELAKDCTDLRQVSADLAQVLRAAERGRVLVERMLTFSRRRERSREQVDLSRVIGEALDFLRASLPSSIQIRRDLDRDTPMVMGDETEFQQVLLNLATNAAQAMHDAGVLDVTLGRELVDESTPSAAPGLAPGMYARLSVSDTGHGMPPEVVERAFEPFFTTRPTGGGTGLGLFVVHGIVTRYGGVVRIQSRPDVGTTIEVFLPGLESPAHDAVAATTSPGNVTARSHVLLVEDEEAIAELGRRQLEQMGYRVTVHTSSLQALEDFRTRPTAFDAVITDNTMPNLTGFALAQEMIRLRPDIPILMVSGLAEGLDPKDVQLAGVRGVLRKPHTGAQLAEAIRTLVRAEPG